MNILYQEIIALYHAYRLGIPNPLKPLRIQYKDFAVWQNTKGFEREEQYWLTKLAGVPQQLRLPYDFPATKERDFRGEIESVVLDADITQGLRALATQKQTTLSNVMLALFNLLLFQLTKQDDFCIGFDRKLANRIIPNWKTSLVSSSIRSPFGHIVQKIWNLKRFTAGNSKCPRSS